MKQKDEIALALAWAGLYVPYAVQGGWVRDDLALLTSTRLAQSYPQWQWFVLANRDMTARPVSAILHGLSYWLFGSDAWRFHLLNLALFGIAILLFYLAIRKLVSRDVAFVAALLALVYPCASTVAFSSIMMNSNLAAFFWSSGLYVAAGNFRWKYLLTTALFAMSALSYEVFIPLFATGILVDIFLHKLHRSDRSLLLMRALPALTAAAVYGVYRGILEKLIFHTTFSRLVITSPPALLGKFFHSLGLGLKVAALDSLVLSLRGFRNLGFVPVIDLALIGGGLVLLAIYLYRSSGPAEAHPGGAAMPVGRSTYLAWAGLAACLFACAHLIYALSNYVPDSAAFSNRTLEGVQFAAALAIALVSVPLYRGLAGPPAARLAALFLIAVLSLFTAGTVGQREAWILAARYNEQVASRITDALRTQEVDPRQTLTLVAVLPGSFPGEINREPTLGVFWDITPLLELHNPGLVIAADVYNPSAVAGSSGVRIQNYDHLWESAYPLWLYSYSDDRMYRVRSQQEWNTYLPLATAASE